jgi:hypothetical protein
MVQPGPFGEMPATDGTVSADYVLGSKWNQPGGLGSAVNLTYSFSNLLDGAMLGGLSSAQLESAAEEALGLWSAVTPLRFTETTDSGPLPDAADTSYTAGTTPKIRFGHHYIDGGSGANVLAHAYYPGTNGISGDVHFDDSNAWAVAPGSGVIDIIEVATHELGHALGLDHNTTTDAIMNPSYGRRFSGPGTGFLLADDIAGIQAQYGAGLGYVISDGVLYLNGTADADALSVDVSGSTFTLSRAGYNATGSTSGLTQIVVNGRGGADTINILHTGGLSVQVSGGAGDDVLNIGSGAAANLSAASTAPITFDGGAGTDATVCFDNGSAFTGTYTLSAGALARSGFGGLTYSALEALSLSASDTASTIDVTGTFSTTPITINGNGGDDVFNISATASGSSPVFIRSGAGNDSVNVNTDNSGVAAVTFDQPREQLAALTLGAGALVSVLSGMTVFQTGILSLNSSSRLELSNNDLIVDNGNFAAIRSAIFQGFGAGATSGITSAASTGSKIHAPFDNGLVGSTSWDGQTIGNTAVVAMFTYFGDVNFDGQVTGDDYTVIDSNLSATPAAGTAWLAGDANMDGVISGDDYTTIDSNLNSGVA